MYRIYLKELEIKVRMIDKILKFSNGIYRRSQLSSKTFSELKYLYYDCRKTIFKPCNN